MNDQQNRPYTQRNLELRAAAYYASIRKPESEWNSIEDLAPQLAEFEHQVLSCNFDEASILLATINDLLYLWGHYTPLLKMRKRLLGHISSPHLQAKNLIHLGKVAYAVGDFEQARIYDLEALAIAQLHNDLELKALCLGNLGDALQNLGRSEEAFEYHQQAVALFEKAGNLRKQAYWLRPLARDYRILGHINQAIVHYQQALDLARQVKDEATIGRILGNLGQAYCAIGQAHKVGELLEQGLAIVRAISDLRYEGLQLGIQGLIYHDLGQAELAIIAYRKALSIARNIGNRRGELTHLGDLGITEYALGDVEQAIALHRQASSIAHQIHVRRRESYNLAALGRALLKYGDLLTAQKCCETACALNILENSYWAYLILSIVYLHLGNSITAETFAITIARCEVLLAKTRNWCRVQYALATALVGQATCESGWTTPAQRPDLLAPALAEYRRALAITAAPGVVRDTIRDLELIRAAGIEGLDPVFALLEEALATDQHDYDAQVSSTNLNEKHSTANF